MVHEFGLDHEPKPPTLGGGFIALPLPGLDPAIEDPNPVIVLVVMLVFTAFAFRWTRRRALVRHRRQRTSRDGHRRAGEARQAQRLHVRLLEHRRGSSRLVRGTITNGVVVRAWSCR